MAGASRTRDFFENGTATQFEWVLGLYDEALRLKAENKSSKPENVIKLDKWYQTELPKKIKARGKEAHLIHDELVQTIKWKLARGKFQANMVNLVQMNTPRVVMQETKKAFRNIYKRGSLESAAQALCNLKGVGPTMASAVLAAGAPHLAPFMADECLLAMPDGEALDYTMKEYMRFVEYVMTVVDRLKLQGGEWTPHKVELAVWTHSVMNEFKAETLLDMPSRHAAAPQAAATATAVTTSAASFNGTDQENGASTSDEEFGSKNIASSVSNGEDSVSSPPPASFSTSPCPSAEPAHDGSNGNGNGSVVGFDEDSNAAKNGDFSLPTSVHDENSVPDVDSVSQDSIPESVELAENGVGSMDRITTFESLDESAQHETSSFNEAAPAAVAAAVTSFAEPAPSFEEPAPSCVEPAPITEITATNGDKPLHENGAKEISEEKVSETVEPSSTSPSLQQPQQAEPEPVEPEPVEGAPVESSPKSEQNAKRAATPDVSTAEVAEEEPASKKFKADEPEQLETVATAV